MDKYPQYFILKNGPEYCGDLLVKFDGMYFIWIRRDRIWFPDPTLLKTHWPHCQLIPATDEEVKKYGI